jgi:hypothetical protein
MVCVKGGEEQISLSSLELISFLALETPKTRRFDPKLEKWYMLKEVKNKFPYLL